MHFLFFSAQYLPTAGGVERFTHSLAATLARQGHAATVVTSALPGLPPRQTDGAGIRILRLPARMLLGGRFPLLQKNRAFRRAAASLWQTPYDFAVINTRFYPLSLWAARQCAARHLPAIVVEHGTKHLSLDCALLNACGNAYEHAAMRLVRRYCSRFYGVSQACADWLGHFRVKARGVLYNAVDAQEIDGIAKAPPCDVRRRFCVGDAPLVCFVGRFIAEKGIRELLQAFRLVRERYPNAALVMAGEGPLLEEVRRARGEGVVLCGGLPYGEAVALMAQSDVFCLPTYSEGFSSTVLEAAAAGACIVTTPTGGSPELIEDGVSGLLLESRRPDAIAAALCRCLGDANFRQSAGAAVRQRVQARFTWAASAQHLLAIVNNLHKD